MKLRYFGLLLLPATIALAQDEPPIEMPENLYFSDDYVLYVPKDTLKLGIRSLAGSKSTFHGFGNVTSVQGQGDFTSRGVGRGYHDGFVSVDARKNSVDDGTGSEIGTTNAPAASDGKTNSWNIQNLSQVQGDNIDFHTYNADILDGGVRSKNPSSSYGIEVGIEHNMPQKLLRWDWNLFGGLSVNGLNSSMSTKEKTRITTVTDTYSLDGAPAPTIAPYTSPSSSTVNLNNANGSALSGSDGTPQSATLDSTTLLASDPLSRTTTTTETTTNVTNGYRIKGAFFTFRAGPVIVIPITQKLHGSFSTGPALVYSGSTYSVTQDFQPDTGPLISDTVSNSKNSFLPGYFADASLELTLTDRAGFYLSAVYQNSGSFTQSIDNGTANYTTKIDLKSLSGLNFGLNVRF